jgi:hypothetical protein
MAARGLHNVPRMTVGAARSTKQWLAILVLACPACAFATVESGPYGVPVDAANRPQTTPAPPPLLISASEASSYSTAYLGLVEVTFENRTSVWKQVERVTLDFGSAAKNQSISIASGDDIDAWERAITIRNALLPTAPPLMGIEAVGGVDKLGAWIGRRRPAAAPPATGAAAAAAPAPEASTVATPPSYPEQHLLTTPFRIPPGLFAKRWILLSTSDNSSGGCIDSMILSYETSDHATGRVRLPFKVNGTDWQAQACYVAGPAPYQYGH